MFRYFKKTETMKKYISLLAVPALALLMGACSKDTENTTWVTYYPQMTVEGDLYLNWEAGRAFQDPGVTVVMNGEEMSADLVTVSTNMDLNNPQPGFYTITYGFTNPEGIVAQATRNIAVYPASDPVVGYYVTDAKSTRSGSEAYAAGKFFPIKVTASNGAYAVNDLLAGYYDLGRGYGSNYALAGVLSIGAGGTITLDSWKACPSWPDNPVEDFGNASYDAATKTFHWIVDYAGTPFDVYITKL